MPVMRESYHLAIDPVVHLDNVGVFQGGVQPQLPQELADLLGVIEAAFGDDLHQHPALGSHYSPEVNPSVAAFNSAWQTVSLQARLSRIRKLKAKRNVYRVG